MKHPLNDITATELKHKIDHQENVQLLDVREEIEFFTFNIGGLNRPLSTFSEYLNQLPYNKDQEIVVICQRGVRSETARRLLKQAGFSNVKNLYGGLLAFRKIDEKQL